jgi:hypothetical protein
MRLHIQIVWDHGAPRTAESFWLGVLPGEAHHMNNPKRAS